MWLWLWLWFRLWLWLLLLLLLLLLLSSLLLLLPVSLLLLLHTANFDKTSAFGLPKLRRNRPQTSSKLRPKCGEIAAKNDEVSKKFRRNFGFPGAADLST